MPASSQWKVWMFKDENPLMDRVGLHLSDLLSPFTCTTTCCGKSQMFGIIPFPGDHQFSKQVLRRRCGFRCLSTPYPFRTELLHSTAISSYLTDDWFNRRDFKLSSLNSSQIASFAAMQLNATRFAKRTCVHLCPMSDWGSLKMVLLVWFFCSLCCPCVGSFFRCL